jgi:hypothetical protein
MINPLPDAEKATLWLFKNRNNFPPISIFSMRMTVANVSRTQNAARQSYVVIDNIAVEIFSYKE